MCVFCKIVNKEIEPFTIYEDERAMAFLDIEPINEGHLLLIPKEHYLDADDMPKELYLHLMELSQRLIRAMKQTYPAPGYTMMQNGGQFNDIGHYHLHIFPRYEGDGFGWTFGDQQKEYNQLIADKIKSKLM